MTEFFASLGLFGWIVIGLALFGLFSLPKALREMWTRPWNRSDPTDRNAGPFDDGDDHP
ncbi:hypothetical protein [Jannaschia sp. 2305UL9-9]|uniref:hypothetical protein n=1 Tax=Jannaschia sp. 2305UL9-9 TaxID=3121638 RepID=UPI003527D4EE